MKIGDIVMLKSGGPAMTIKAVTSSGVLCVWFTGDNVLCTAEFSLDLLKPAKADK